MNEQIKSLALLSDKYKNIVPCVNRKSLS